MADDTPDVAEGIAKARAAGYSDDEIANHLSDKLPGIKKARDAGYSNAEILTHLGGSKSAPSEDVSTAGDVAKSTASGIGKGIIGLAGAIPAAEGALKNAANKYLFDPMFNAVSGPRKAAPEAPDAGSIVSGGLNDVSDQLYAPRTTAGKYAQSVGEMLPNVVGGPEGLGYKLLTRAVAPGLASEAAGQATKGTAAEPYARLAAAVLGGGAAEAAGTKLTGAGLTTPMRPVTAADNADAAKTMYNSPLIEGTTIDPLAANIAGARMEQALRKSKFNEQDHSAAFNQARELQNATDPMTLNDFDTVRKRLNEAAGETNEGRATSAAAAAQMAKEHLDNFVNNLSQRDTLSGNLNLARQTMDEARATAGAGIRSDQARIKLANAMWNNDAANSANNLGNRIRQAFKPDLMNDGRRITGHSPEEVAALEKLVRGAKLANGLRLAGSSLGGPGITSAGAAIAALTTGNLLPFIVPAAGFALKGAANLAQKAAADRYVRMLSQASPMGQRIAAGNAAIKAGNSAVIRRDATQGALRAAAAQLLLNRNAP